VARRQAQVKATRLRNRRVCRACERRGRRRTPLASPSAPPSRPRTLTLARACSAAGSRAAGAPRQDGRCAHRRACLEALRASWAVCCGAVHAASAVLPSRTHSSSTPAAKAGRCRRLACSCSRSACICSSDDAWQERRGRAEAPAPGPLGASPASVGAPENRQAVSVSPAAATGAVALQCPRARGQCRGTLSSLRRACAYAAWAHARRQWACGDGAAAALTQGAQRAQARKQTCPARVQLFPRQRAPHPRSRDRASSSCATPACCSLGPTPRAHRESPTLYAEHGWY
jgi:hypothetical protein